MKATNFYSLFDDAPVNLRRLSLIIYSVPGSFFIAVFLIDSSKFETNKSSITIVLLNAIISLKGAASNIGTEQLRQSAALIESAARAENISTISDSIVQCNDQLKVFIKEASEYLETSKHTGKEE